MIFLKSHRSHRPPKLKRKTRAVSPYPRRTNDFFEIASGVENQDLGIESKFTFPEISSTASQGADLKSKPIFNNNNDIVRV